MKLSTMDENAEGYGMKLMTAHELKKELLSIQERAIQRQTTDLEQTNALLSVVAEALISLLKFEETA